MILNTIGGTRLFGRAGRVAARRRLRKYRELESGERWPNRETFHHLYYQLYGWQQPFASGITDDG